MTTKDKKKLDKWKWPYGGRGEIACPHGVGHGMRGIHGCDGCCDHPNFEKTYQELKAKGYRLK